MASPFSKKRRVFALPPALASERLLVRLNPHQVGMFRFLLEAYEHLAGFTVLDRRTALLKVFFSPHQERDVLLCLHDISQELELTISPWPVAERTPEQAGHVYNLPG